MYKTLNRWYVNRIYSNFLHHQSHWFESNYNLKSYILQLSHLLETHMQSNFKSVLILFVFSFSFDHIFFFSFKHNFAYFVWVYKRKKRKYPLYLQTPFSCCASASLYSAWFLWFAHKCLWLASNNGEIVIFAFFLGFFSTYDQNIWYQN